MIEKLRACPEARRLMPGLFDPDPVIDVPALLAPEANPPEDSEQKTG